MLYNIRVSEIEQESTTNGKGNRFVVYAQGCEHHCEGCNSPHTHRTNRGYFETVEHIMVMFNSNPCLDGMTFSGGEPFMQPKAFAALAKEVHKTNKDVWCYTGNTLEYILNWISTSLLSEVNYLAERAEEIIDLLNNIDVLIDGEFKKELSCDNIPYIGSANERIIDMPATRKKSYEEIVLL